MSIVFVLPPPVASCVASSLYSLCLSLRISLVGGTSQDRLSTAFTSSECGVGVMEVGVGVLSQRFFKVMGVSLE